MRTNRATMWIQCVMTVLSGCSARVVSLAMAHHPPSAHAELEDLIALRFNHVNRTSHSGVEGVDQPEDLQRLGRVLHGQPYQRLLDRPSHPLSLIHISEPTRLGMISYA